MIAELLSDIKKSCDIVFIFETIRVNVHWFSKSKFTTRLDTSVDFATFEVFFLATIAKDEENLLNVSCN